MLKWHIAAIAFFLLLSFGCGIRKDTGTLNPFASCASSCESSHPNTYGNISGGECRCLCRNGYQELDGVCYPQHDYNIFRLAKCKSDCSSAYQHTSGVFKDGNCACPCEKGFVAYNKTCITPQEFEMLAPILCKEGFPVLKIYDWTFESKSHYLSICYGNATAPGALENRNGRRDYWNFVNDPSSSASVSIVTDQLASISEQENYTGYERAGLAISFVQSLPYTFDNASTPFDDYPRYPSETIYADGGDCEDTSILLAAILRRMGYGAALLSMPRHVAAGISCNQSDFNRTIAAYPYNGSDYCYIETTGEGYGIGELPAAIPPDSEVEVVPIPNPQPDVYLGWGRKEIFHTAYSYDSRDTYVNVTGIRVDNFGTMPAKDVSIIIALESAKEGKPWDSATIRLGDIPVRGYNDGAYATNLHVPTGEEFRVSVAVQGSNFDAVQKEGGWATWH